MLSGRWLHRVRRGARPACHARGCRIWHPPARRLQSLPRLLLQPRNLRPALHTLGKLARAPRGSFGPSGAAKSSHCPAGSIPPDPIFNQRHIFPSPSSPRAAPADRKPFSSPHDRCVHSRPSMCAPPSTHAATRLLLHHTLVSKWHTRKATARQKCRTANRPDSQKILAVSQFHVRDFLGRCRGCVP